MTTLSATLESLPDSKLRSVFEASLKSICEIAQVLREHGGHKTISNTNAFGDAQLQIDVQADEIIQKHLAATGHVRAISSEERPYEILLSEDADFSVAYDPLDGSSILPTNFAVGTIIGIWRSPNFVGATGSTLVASLAAVYGPRTTVYLSSPLWGDVGVHEVTLGVSGLAQAVASLLPKVGEGKLFAPANLRSSADHPGYSKLIQFYMEQRYTLRYTGGMVPDVTQILVKGFGVFASPVSKDAPAKLRLLYEAMPMAALVEAAGGASSDGNCSLLERTILHFEERTPVCLGSTAEVARFEQFCPYQR